MKSDKPSANNNLGLSYFEKGDFDEALKHYTKAINIDKTSVHFSNRGLAHYHIGKLDEAEKDFNSALDKDPNDPHTFFNRGNVYLNMEVRQYELAHRDYDTAISLAPNNAKFWHSKGLAFQQ